MIYWYVIVSHRRRNYQETDSDQKTNEACDEWVMNTKGHNWFWIM